MNFKVKLKIVIDIIGLTVENLNKESQFGQSLYIFRIQSNSIGVPIYIYMCVCLSLIWWIKVKNLASNINKAICFQPITAMFVPILNVYNYFFGIFIYIV